MPFDPAPAAAILADAVRTGALLTALPEAVRPATMDQGYDVQDRLIAALGHRVAGWKLGLGSRAQKRDLGIGRSVAGRVLAPNLHRSGDTIRLPNAAPVTIEFELAYILGRDVSPDGEPPIIAEHRVTFELVRSRFIDRRAAGWPSFAADNGAFQALVLGDAISPEDAASLPAAVTVFANGQAMARGVEGDDATDPAAAFADLVAMARERGMTLPAGSIISTGTISRPFDITAPATIEARYLGHTLSIRLTGP